MNTADQHIADRPEMIEEFLLGRLGKNASDAIAQHLRSCERCSEAVASERRLIAAVRRSGRDVMKERLRANLDTEEATLRFAVPWPRVFAIAATVVILIGFGLAGRWLFLHYGMQEQISEQSARTETKEPEVLSQDNRVRAEEPASLGKKDQSSEPRVRELAEGRSDVAGKVKGIDRSGGASQNQEAPQPALVDQDKEKRPAPALAAQEYAKSITKDEGYTSDALRRRDAPQAGARPGSVAHKPVVVFMRIAAPEAHDRRALNSEAQLKQPSADTNVVSVTLYLSPRDSSFLHLTPVTRWITDDSLLVSVGDTAVGYRLPLTR